MPSIKDLKKRIGTVKNTQQTTRAMKMVSAAKLRRAQEAVQNQRPYAKRILNLIQQLAPTIEISENSRADGSFSRIINQRMVEEDVLSSDSQRKVLLVLVTSDRGLCGGFNSSVIKSAQRWISGHSDKNCSVELAFVGKKGYDFFKNRKVKVAANFQELTGKVTFKKAKKLSEALVDRFMKSEFSEIKFIFNEFKNAVFQEVTVDEFLPLMVSPKKKDDTPPREGDAILDYLVKPSSAQVFQKLIEKNFAIQVFRILLESQAGEHGARMSAMENATKNASEMIRKLTLQYNKQRQASITKELLEIIAGSESQKC